MDKRSPQSLAAERFALLQGKKFYKMQKKVEKKC
jgi:hypothetical protein